MAWQVSKGRCASSQAQDHRFPALGRRNSPTWTGWARSSSTWPNWPSEINERGRPTPLELQLSEPGHASRELQRFGAGSLLLPRMLRPNVGAARLGHERCELYGFAAGP